MSLLLAVILLVAGAESAVRSAEAEEACGKGHYALATKEYAVAASWFSKAVELAPDFAEAHRGLGESLLKLIFGFSPAKTTIENGKKQAPTANNYGDDPAAPPFIAFSPQPGFSRSERAKGFVANAVSCECYRRRQVNRTCIPLLHVSIASVATQEEW